MAGRRIAQERKAYDPAQQYQHGRRTVKNLSIALNDVFFTSVLKRVVPTSGPCQCHRGEDKRYRPTKNKQHMLYIIGDLSSPLQCSTGEDQF